MGQPIVIESIKKSISGDTHRISSIVDGLPVWFESNLDLTPVAEAFISPFVLPAMANNRPIESHDASDSTWLTNNKKVQQIFSDWWDFTKFPIKSSVTDRAKNQGGKRALFFTGGVDSFYSLLNYPDKIDYIINIHGMDVALDDNERARMVESLLVKVSSKYKVNVISIKTNFYQHPLFRSISLGKSHGGLLAAVGLVLGGYISKAIISSTNPVVENVPWGSHWETDILWSNGETKLEHWGQHKRRSEKLESIAYDSFVQNNLMVCVKSSPNHLNCGTCEKCTRTIIKLNQLGVLDKFRVLKPIYAISEQIRHIKRIKKVVRHVYRDDIKTEPDPEIRKAIRALLNRSEGITRIWHRLMWKRN